jgi:DNA-binding MarR family transcriptional regulator
MKSRQAVRQTNRNAASARFSVRDYPFFFMHTIIHKNNENIGDALKHLGFTPVIWRVLALLQENDGISISELSQQSLIERTLLSRLLSDMEHRGYVRKEPDRRDKRYTAVYLQSAGYDAFEKVLPIARRQIERAVAGLSQRDLDKLQQILRHITENLNRSPYI